MTVASTSRQAYRQIKPDLKRRRRQVYDIIADWPAGKPDPSIADIAQRLGWQNNEVSGRVTELRKDHLIIITGKKFNPSGKRARTYRIPASSEQLTLFQTPPNQAQ